MTVNKLHRKTDPKTSRLAAEKIWPHLSYLQRYVLSALETHGPMTDEQLSSLPLFDDCGESTARGRRSELTQKPLELIEDSGIKRNNSHGNPVIVWKLKPKETLF